MAEELDFDADKFMRLPRSERASLCRKLAERATSLAAAADGHHRESYRQIARAWLQLASELDAESG